MAYSCNGITVVLEVGVNGLLVQVSATSDVKQMYPPMSAKNFADSLERESWIQQITGKE